MLYKAHRFSYMLYVAESEDIEPGMDVDHRCRNRKCVQPDHLELVTHTENMRRIAERRIVLGDDESDEPDDDDTPVEPEVVLESIKKMLGPDEWSSAAGIASVEGAPWRGLEADIEEHFDATDRWQRVALLLYAVECGIKPRVAAWAIFNATPAAMNSWSKNDDWKKDLSAARKKSIMRGWENYQDTFFDRAERKMKKANAQDLARFGAILVKQNAVEASKGKGNGKSGPTLLNQGNIFVQLPSNPGQVLDDIIEAGYARVIDAPALPAPDDEDDEDD